MTVTAARPLWPRQRDAADATTKTLRERATAVAACGAGKTRIGGEAAATLVPPGGRLLIVAPTLEMISQSLHEYRERYGDAAGDRYMAQAGAACRLLIIGVDLYVPGSMVASFVVTERRLRRTGALAPRGRVR